jgi:hypothetical protein
MLPDIRNPFLPEIFDSATASLEDTDYRCGRAASG